MSEAAQITLPPPSVEVEEEAFERARALADGLFGHQVEGVAFLLARRRAILADDMGLGKTRQSIVALSHAEPEGPYLVVCPASVKRNWVREIDAVRPGSEAHIVGPAAPPPSGFAGWVIVNYDILSKHLGALKAHRFTGIVFDEAHYIKNHTSRRSKLARELAALDGTDPVIHALTGTPLTNRPRDLFPILQLVGHPMGKSFLSFAKRYCDARHNGYGWVTDGASNIEELTVQLQGALLRRNKADVLDLPPKVRTWLQVDVPAGTATREIREVVETLIRARLGQASGDGDRGQRVRLLAKLTKARHRLAGAKVKQTIDFIRGAVEQGEKVIVFSCFDEPVQAVKRAFEDACVVLTGKTPTSRRQKMVDRFQEDQAVKVFAANIVAGGVGINLTAARQVVFNDLDWVPANHWQAEDRAYRIGQTHTVHVSYFVAADTVDLFVQQVLETKAALVDAIIEGKALEAGSGDVLGELERLIGQLSPQLTDPSVNEGREDWLQDLIGEIRRIYEREHGQDSQAAGEARQPPLSEDAIRVLAQVLSSPTARRFKAASSSKPGEFYTIVENDADLACTCPGFEYRGSCRHVRTLKAALAKNQPLPSGYSVDHADQ